jgi:hypothetical protein
VVVRHQYLTVPLVAVGRAEGVRRRSDAPDAHQPVPRVVGVGHRGLPLVLTTSVIFHYCTEQVQ